MHALMAYIPEKKIGIVILTNTWGNKVPEVLYNRFFDLYLNKNSLQDWNKVYLKKQEEAVADEKVKHSDNCHANEKVNLDKYVGKYSNLIFGVLKVSKEADHLKLSIEPIAINWELSYCKDNTFKAFWPNPYGMNITMLPVDQILIEFTEGDNKRIVRMTILYLNGDGWGVFEKVH